MKRIRVSSLAERDLDEIWYEIAKRSGSIQIANGVVDSITDVFPYSPKIRRPAGIAMIFNSGFEGMRDQMAAYFPGKE
jgi:hypothetical protein